MPPFNRRSLIANPIIASHREILCTFALGLCFIACGLGQAQQSSRLSTVPWREVTFPFSFSHSMSYPELSNSSLISYSRPELSSDKGSSLTTFKVLHLNTGAAQTVNLQLPSADIRVEDAAVIPTGGVVAVGSYYDSEKQKVNSFLLSLLPSGGETFRVDLGTFEPHRACVGADGTTWVLGRNPASENTVPIPDYDMVLSFSPSGVQTGHYLPRSTFPTNGALSLRREVRGSVALLDCTATAAGIYIATKEGATWSEISEETGRVNTRTTFTPPHSHVSGIAFLNSDELYASIATDGSSHLYKFASSSTSSGEWSEMSTQGSFARLLGKDNGSLVYFNADTDHFSPTLLWSHQ
jgi:hypothetical protein